MKKPSSLRSWSISVLVVLISQGIPEYAQSHDISSWIISTAGTGQWQRINSSGMPLSEFRFGDFDGNGKADMFRSAGGKWYVSYDGVGP